MAVRRLDVDAMTWRDEAAAWPQGLETNRADVVDPDSVGVRLYGPAGSELEIVVFRGGWADLDYLTPDGKLVAECPEFSTAVAVASLLDDRVTKVWTLAEADAEHSNRRP